MGDLHSLRIRFGRLRYAGNGSGSIENHHQNIKNVSFHSNLGRMTIDLLFIANNKLVARVNMCASNFGNKILDTFTEEELEKFTPIPKGDNTEDETFTCKEFIERFGMRAYVTGTFRKITTC